MGRPLSDDLSTRSQRWIWTQQYSQFTHRLTQNPVGALTPAGFVVSGTLAGHIP